MNDLNQEKLVVIAKKYGFQLRNFDLDNKDYIFSLFCGEGRFNFFRKKNFTYDDFENLCYLLHNSDRPGGPIIINKSFEILDWMCSIGTYSPHYKQYEESIITNYNKFIK